MSFIRASVFSIVSALVLVAAASGAQKGATQKSAKPQPAKPQPAKPQAAKTEAKPKPAVAIDPLDWPYWRGPEQNGISRETGLIDHWDLEGDNVLWKSSAMGSRSTPIVMRGKIYTICRHEPGTSREQEKVVCADAATGEILWENRFNVFLSDVPKERIGWSCCAGDPTTGRVYVMGVCDYFQCLDGETGETIWSHSLSEEYGFLSTYGGRTNVPLIYEDTVIINAVVIGWGEMAVPAHRFVAFNKQTGVPVWFNGTRLRPDDTTYSTPVLTVLGGQAALVFGSGDGGVWAFQPRTGRPLWSYQLSLRGLNVTPLIDGDTIYMSHSEENPPPDTSMGSIAAINGTANTDPAAKDIDTTKSATLWRNKEIMVGKSSPILVDGRIYGLDDSNLLYIFDAKTGKPIGRKQRLIGTITRASPLYADGRIYACTTSAWHVLVPTEEGVKITHRVRFGQGEEIHGSPIVSHGRIYLPTTETLYCLADKDAKTSASAQPELAKEDGLSDKEPAHVQVVPVESLIEPGASVEYTVRLFNARGQSLGEAKDVSFQVDGGGTIDDHGRFTADDKHGQAGVVVTAKVGDLKGTARIRIVPPFPWKYDFANQKVPITWVGARYRHISLDFDLLESLKQQDVRAGQLYIYCTTAFTNSGQEKASFNDRTPRRTWTDFLRYLELDESDVMKTLEGAKKELDPALKVVKDSGAVSDYKWSSVNGDVGLDVTKGKPENEKSGVMVKITTIPKGTRSQCWMGPPKFHDYTIQADVRGTIRDGKQPDIGLIAQRYTLDLMGVKQQLQIRSWTSELGRFSKTVPFNWNYDTWYTIKFRASVEEGKAVLKGKVWPKGQAEPDDWSIEAVDDMPNVIGSPGLFGNASDAEIFLD
ncbi:MAG TPA: PQQ-binding-like beta-propeller repeat protein, partial [Pirellulales bacterium]|nr:PQQ-binding-like beta-propeller repeat protein [Pirellulales bacterium]